MKELRKKAGFSQEAFADLCDLDRTYMGGIERGLRNPSLTTIARVAAGLGMSMSEVLKAVERSTL